MAINRFQNVTSWNYIQKESDSSRFLQKLGYYSSRFLQILPNIRLGFYKNQGIIRLGFYNFRI